MSGALIAVLIEKMPAIITLAQGWFHEAHPELPTPTSEDVIAAWLVASGASLNIDDAWLASH